MAYLARASASERLRMADAVAASKQSERDYAQWIRDARFLAGG